MVTTPDPFPIPTSGNDRIIGTGLDDVLPGYNGNDQLYGGAWDDVFQEGLHQWGANVGPFLFGQNVLLGQYVNIGLGNDTLYGGGGNDSLVGGDGADLVYGDAGNETIALATDGDRAYGGNGADSITGNSHNVALYGDADNDELTLVSGAVPCPAVLAGRGCTAMPGPTVSPLRQPARTSHSRLMTGQMPTLSKSRKSRRWLIWALATTSFKS